MLRFHTGGIAQYLECCITCPDFIYSDAIYFHSFRKKTSECVNAAGDRCMAIAVIQYFIVIEC